MLRCCGVCLCDRFDATLAVWWHKREGYDKLSIKSQLCSPSLCLHCSCSNFYQQLIVLCLYGAFAAAFNQLTSSQFSFKIPAEGFSNLSFWGNHLINATLDWMSKDASSRRMNQINCACVYSECAHTNTEWTEATATWFIYRLLDSNNQIVNT